MSKYKFDSLGVMIDMSRNAVMSLDGLKRFLPILKKMGYKTVFLYTEDTYEVEGEPYFGYMRGRYSVEEMREIDALCTSLDMEAIPCIQTLAHLKTLMKWEQHPFDGAGVLLVDDDRTYELIDRMFATLRKCFRTDKIHIGMDEAFYLGRGKHLDKHGFEPTADIMKRHLERVCALADKYGYEPMLWSDMFFSTVTNHTYYTGKTQLPQEWIDALPEKCIPIYWDYYQTDQQKFEDMLDNHLQLSDKTWFAGGIWSWTGFIPHNHFSIRSMKLAVNACKKYNTKNIFFCMWGDDGAECSHFAQLPALHYLAMYAKGVTDEEKIKAKFKSLTGIDYDDFIAIDDVNNIIGYENNDGAPRNPSKHWLLCDTFNGHFDYTAKEGCGANCARTAEKLHAVAKQSRKYGYVFETAACLADVLAVKYELGVKVRRAYQAGDREELRRLVDNEYSVLPSLIKKFHTAFEKQWMKDNKSYGFDVQDIRIAGVRARIDSCRRRLENYLDGKTDRIEELECEILPFGAKERSLLMNGSPNMMTSSIL
ncbi:MAG: beta-N-acetylhexosaminidase [Clostridia bacterium]|nr:beta-N-acetylhexosaminidase [Clostridia bacterium]